MNKSLSVLFSIFLGSIIWGCQNTGNESADSHDQVSERISLDSLDKLESLVNDVKLNNSGESVHYARLALTLSRQQATPAYLVKAYVMMGTAYFSQKIDSSLFYFSEALKIADNNNLNQPKPSIFLNLSNIYAAASDYKTSIVFLDSSVRLASINKDYEALSNAYNNLGNIKYDLHDFPDAERMFDTAYDIALQHTLPKQMGVALGSLARFEKDISQSIRIHKRAIELLKKSPGTEEAVARLWINIGNRWDKPDSAIKYYSAAIQTVERDTSNEVMMSAYNNLVYSYIDKREYAKADLCLSRHAIPIAQKLLNFEWLATLHDTYYDLLMAEGKSKEAAIAEKKAYKYREKAYDFKVTGQVRLLAALLDVKNKEFRLQSIDQELRRKVNKINLLSVIFIFFAGLTVFIILWILQKNRLNAEKQRLSSANRIIELDESQKGRLAMELHDMTSPLYTSLLRQIEDVEIPDTAIKDELFSSLTILADRLRKISHEMSGIHIEQLTFHEIVQGLCEEMQYRTDAQIRLHLDQHEITLSAGKATHVIRIIQELLTNGVKYVKQGEISLSVSVEFENMNIIYHDNGAGFDVNTKIKTGLGLTNIFERAKLLGGNAFLESTPLKGTHWIVRIPMKHQ